MSNSLWPHDYTIHGILQARILEWVAFPLSRGSSQPRNWTQASCITGGFFTSWATRLSQRILEWVAYPFSRGSSWPRNQTGVSCTADRFFTNWAIREVLYYIYYINVCMDLYSYAYSQQSLHLSSLKKTMRFGTCLVIQWLTLCSCTGDLGSIFGQGTRSRMPQLNDSN